MRKLTPAQIDLLERIVDLPYGMPGWECNQNTAEALVRRGLATKIETATRLWGYLRITDAGRAALEEGE